MVVALQVTNASCLCISVLKCATMKPDGIIDEVFVLGDYSKWKDRSIDRQGIEYFNLLTSTAQLETTSLFHWTNQVISYGMNIQCHSII